MKVKSLLVVCLSAFLLTSAAVSQAWTQLASGGPPGRSRHCMAYDSLRDRVVMFGGRSGTSGSGMGDTWEWDNSSWVQVASGGPAPRHGASMAYDPTRGVTVLFGGEDGSNVFVDTWEWDGATWSQVSSVPPSVTGLGCAMVFDPAGGQILMLSVTSSASSTWAYDGNVWQQIASQGPTGPYGVALVYDAARGRPMAYTYPGVSVEWDGTAWVGSYFGG